MIKTIFIILTIFIITFVPAYSQIKPENDLTGLDYTNPKEYEIGGVTVSGIQFLDNSVLITLSGLTVGDKIKIPGDKITKAIENLWKQGLFEDIKISADKIDGNLIFLDINLKERPRLSKFSFNGIKKGEADKLRDEIKLTRGDIVTENVIVRTRNTVIKHFVDKGYLFAAATVTQKKDTSIANSVELTIDVKKNGKVKISHINITGNNNLEKKKLKQAMKKTKEKHLYRLFATSRFNDEEYIADKQKVIDKYNELGYRDAKIEKDTVYKSGKNTVNIDLAISEGHKYYFRNITWVGNTKYSVSDLNPRSAS